jgi:hypothetical protein
MREKSQCNCLGGPPRKQFFSGPGKVKPKFYFEGTKGRGVTTFKETIRTFLKVLAVLSFRPKTCTDDVCNTYFPRENVPLSLENQTRHG